MIHQHTQKAHVDFHYVADVPRAEFLLRTYLKGEVAVVNEDIAYLEALQSRLHGNAPRAQQGRYEDRLRAAAEVYLDLLGPERAS